jgi:hypothetical protein
VLETELNPTLDFQEFMNNGLVDYARLKEEPSLSENLDIIAHTDISTLDTDETLAFWLNAYNLLTIKSVCLEFEANPNWKGNISWYSKLKFFIIRKHLVAGRKYSLYHIENRIIRKQFQEPRIHFALNCGSLSCPFLPSNLFTSQNLDQRLNDLTIDFINDQKGVQVSGQQLILSRIFKWYRKDFKAEGGIVQFISRYWKGKTAIPNNPKIKFAKYQWKINS